MSKDARGIPSHALIDGIVEGIAVSESRAPLLALTATRTDLLMQAGRARHPLVFLTGDGTRLTEPMRAALAATRIPWVVRTAGGLRDGLTWRPLADLAAAFDAAPADAAELARVYGTIEVASDARCASGCFTTWEPEGVIGVRLIEAAARVRGGAAVGLSAGEARRGRPPQPLTSGGVRGGTVRRVPVASKAAASRSRAVSS